MLFVNIASDVDRQALALLTQSAVGRVAQRAWMVIWSDAQVTVQEIAARLRYQPKCVRKWLHRYRAGGCTALADLPRCGRPTKLDAIAEQAVFCQVNQPPYTFGYVFALWSIATLCQHLTSRCSLRLSHWRLRQLLKRLRYRFRRPKLAPRREDPQHQAIHQQISHRIAEASRGTVILIEDETDIRLFPVLRRMWMWIGQQVKLVAPMKNQSRMIFDSIELNTGEAFYRTYSRKRTVEMSAIWKRCRRITRAGPCC